jgi:hypothetical protein
MISPRPGDKLVALTIQSPTGMEGVAFTRRPPTRATTNVPRTAPTTAQIAVCWRRIMG